MSDCEGFDDVLLGLAWLGFTEANFLGVRELSALSACFEDGNLILEGLSLEFGSLPAGVAVDEEIDMRDREGRRSFDIGCETKSLPI